MTDALLLPSSSTKLERDLSTSMDSLPRLGAAAELIRDAKRENIPDSVVPFLLYEYGLGELLPYLSDPRTAISTGVLWQRLRGTPKSFSIALGWIGNDGTIEESEGNTINWSQFQLGLDSAPVDLSQTDSVVEIGRLSSPVRSSLFRIYGGWYDGRRFQLDNHQLSGLDTLCDHTGVYLKSEWPQLSFGREFKDEQGDISGDLGAILGVHRATGINGRYEDRTILSNSLLGDTSWRTLHIEDLSSVISRLHFSVSGPWWNNATDWMAAYDWTQVFDWAGLQNKFQPALKFARAGLYLSDYSELGDTNACFPARSLDEFGDGAVLLSEGNPDTGEHILSEHLARVEFTEINERIEHETQLGSMWVGGGNNQVQVETHQLEHGSAYASTGHPNPPAHATLITSLSANNATFNNRQNFSQHLFGDVAGHLLGVGNRRLHQDFIHTNDFSNTNYIDPLSVYVDEVAQTINFKRLVYNGAYFGNSTLFNYSREDNEQSISLYDELGDRRVWSFGPDFEITQNTNITQQDPGHDQFWGTAATGLFIGTVVELLPSHREHTREHLLYDDSFELSRSRLSEFTPLINEQANSRDHTTNALQTHEQSDQWQDTVSNWGTEATGSWETVASYFDSISQGDTWNSENWNTGEYFGNADTDTWGNTFAWRVFPQLEQILGFSLAGICLSETGQLSDKPLAWNTAINPAGSFMGTQYTNDFYASSVGIDPSSVVVDEAAGEIRATEIVRNPFTLGQAYWQISGTITIPLYNDIGLRRSYTFEGPVEPVVNGYGTLQFQNVYIGNRVANLLYGVESDDGILGETNSTLGFFEDERIERSHQTTSAAHNPSGFWYLLRERFATLPYDDLFELSRTRLDEFIPLVNEQAITREHYGVGSSDTEQSDQWQDTSSTWGTDAAGSWATVASYFDSLGEGDTWNTEDWNTGEYFANADTDTWTDTFAWKIYPQIEQVLSFYQSHQYLSDTEDGLSETDSVLGWPTSQRFERDHYAEATENRQSFTTRQHVRTYRPAIVALYVEPTWLVGSWAGPDATGWVQATSDWIDNSTNEWYAANWPTELWAENSVSDWTIEDWIDADPTTWAKHQMWAKIAGWQIASLVVEGAHETHT